MRDLLTDNQYNIRALVRLYRQTRLEVVGKLDKAKTDASILRQRAVLTEIDAILQQTAGQTRAWVEKNVPAMYADGASHAVAALDKIKAPVKVSTGFSLVHQEAIKLLTDSTFIDFAQGLTTVRRTAQGTLAEAAKVQIRDQIGKGIIEGATLKDTKTAVAQIIRDRGVTALQDRGGKSWDLETYSEMLVRTKQRDAFNSGTSNRLVENGYDLVQISDHNADDSCADWENEIVSLTGATPGYATLAEVEGDDTHMFGPNCRHTYTAYVPGLSDKTKGASPDLKLSHRDLIETILERVPSETIAGFSRSDLRRMYTEDKIPAAALQRLQKVL